MRRQHPARLNFANAHVVVDKCIKWRSEGFNSFRLDYLFLSFVDICGKRQAPYSQVYLPFSGFLSLVGYANSRCGSSLQYSSFFRSTFYGRRATLVSQDQTTEDSDTSTAVFQAIHNPARSCLRPPLIEAVLPLLRPPLKPEQANKRNPSFRLSVFPSFLLRSRGGALLVLSPARMHMRKQQDVLKVSQAYRTVPPYLTHDTRVSGFERFRTKYERSQFNIMT